MTAIALTPEAEAFLARVRDELAPVPVAANCFGNSGASLVWQRLWDEYSQCR